MVTQGNLLKISFNLFFKFLNTVLNTIVLVLYQNPYRRRLVTIQSINHLTKTDSYIASLFATTRINMWLIGYTIAPVHAIDCVRYDIEAHIRIYSDIAHQYGAAGKAYDCSMLMILSSKSCDITQRH